MHVTSEAAKKAIDGALKKAESTDTRMCIAVVDSWWRVESILSYG